MWLPLTHPYWRSGLQPRPVPWLGIEPATLWFAGQCSVHWATPARAPFPYLRNTLFIQNFNNFFNSSKNSCFFKNGRLNLRKAWFSSIFCLLAQHLLLLGHELFLSGELPLARYRSGWTYGPGEAIWWPLTSASCVQHWSVCENPNPSRANLLGNDISTWRGGGVHLFLSQDRKGKDSLKPGIT